MSEKYTLKRPILFVKLNPEELTYSNFEDTPLYKMTEKLMVQAVDRREQAITDEVIRVAKEAGVTELYLLDKQFIVEAIREKMEREQVVKDCSTCGEEYRDLHFYPCCACHNIAPRSMSNWHPEGTPTPPRTEKPCRLEEEHE